MPGTAKLNRRFAPMAKALLKWAKGLDGRFRFTSTFRSSTDQARLYNAWLRGDSPFPALPPGRSQHERGLAVDMARFGVPAEGDDLLREVGRAWREAGGVWGGEKDPVHFEAPKALTGRK